MCYNRDNTYHGRESKVMKKKRRSSVFSGLLVFILLIIVACTVVANLIFSGDRIPKLAGYYLYLQEEADMEPYVPAKSLVVAEPSTFSELHEGNKVLCYLADGTLALRNIYRIEQKEDGTVDYYPGTVIEQGTELAISRTEIFAVCMRASPELYAYIQFATTVTGLMCLLVAPCVILIIMLLVHIARNGGEDMDDEEFTFEEEQPQPKKPQPKTKPAAVESPLYNPENKAIPEALEEKKSTISENFASKPVNENSPYQKAVQEREKTMKFKRQEIEEEALRALEEPYPGRKKTNTQVYSSEEIREQARLKAQQSAQQKPEPIRPAEIQRNPEPVPPPKPEPMLPPPVPTNPEPPAPAPAPKPEPPAPAPVKKPEAPKPKPTYSSPNIDDILNATKKSKSAIASSDSIDDLIRLIENEKKKL